MSRLTVGSIEGLTENSNVISVPTGHKLNVTDAAGLQIGGTALGTAVAFTPTWSSGFTAGNAIQEWYYTQIGDIVIVDGKTSLGSTSAVSSVPIMTLPVTRDNYEGSIHKLGFGSFGDSGTATYQVTIIATSATNAIFFSQNASVTYLKEGSVSATVPFTWTTNDFIGGTMIYKAA